MKGSRLKAIKSIAGRGRAAHRGGGRPGADAIGAAAGTALLDLRSVELRRLTGIVGDEALAGRVEKLALRFPNATIPELSVYDWLRRQQVEFTFQGEFGGGRSLRGGAVPDFVIDQGGHGLVWRVQGEYWHSRLGNRDKDLAQKIAMMGQNVSGVRVGTVVDVWERDIYQRREHTLRMALAGASIRE